MPGYKVTAVDEEFVNREIGFSMTELFGGAYDGFHIEAGNLVVVSERRFHPVSEKDYPGSQCGNKNCQVYGSVF